MDIPKSFGALLIGGLFAAVLSGSVAVQVIIYFKMYPSDTVILKSLVLFVWVLDICHTSMIWSALWDYLIANFGDANKINYIPWNVALTILFTAILTFAVHCFFAHRIFMLSKRSLRMTIPIVVLATLRLASACATTGEMVRLHSFPEFKARFLWLFSLGLALSSLVDILITGSLLFLLQTSRSEATNLNIVIDLLIRYAFETGTLTCAGTIASMICYLAMSGNLIFMALHFVISKLYATSLLVTLNTRQTLRHARSQRSIDGDFPAIHLGHRRNKGSNASSSMSPSSQEYSNRSDPVSRKLEISVERSVEYKSDVRPSSPPISVRFHDL